MPHQSPYRSISVSPRHTCRSRQSLCSGLFVWVGQIVVVGIVNRRMAAAATARRVLIQTWPRLRSTCRFAFFTNLCESSGRRNRSSGSSTDSLRQWEQLAVRPFVATTAVRVPPRISGVTNLNESLGHRNRRDPNEAWRPQLAVRQFYRGHECGARAVPISAFSRICANLPATDVTAHERVTIAK
jgi:hypothetical protein